MGQKVHPYGFRLGTLYGWQSNWFSERRYAPQLHEDVKIRRFIKKKLYPTVDFYTGVILNAIGFPTDMFTALFALARTVGWVAQWNEMISDPEQKIGRPRQLYTGATPRDYVPCDKR